MDFLDRLRVARTLKEDGNEFLNSGDYEDALSKYNEGLRQLDPELFGELSASQLKQLQDGRVPLLLNSVLCDLRMNPEEQTRRLTIAEGRIAEVLRIDPNNVKALFRRAQLHGRAGEYLEAKALLERLCRQQPTERSFRAELASLNERLQVAKRETAAFWSVAVKRTLAESELNTSEPGETGKVDGRVGNYGSFSLDHVVYRLQAAVVTVANRIKVFLMLLWRTFAQLSNRQENRNRVSNTHAYEHVL